MCGQPSIPSNAEIVNNATDYQIGYQAVFMCAAGFEPVIEDNNFLTCNSSGQWEGNSYACRGE